ncbi:sigma-70 family RNA polymerase sigma factor [Chengkuizengella axinellae]|uniref:Sigma-70 family RNA polymerase sigma factor n=1 Tax=Chengkuizengella axinellae TaxID=3064388 RepID=A0ABT9IXX4_9BACL|nr:sigma-70 family RNA polymerase sigma factor [Chengkuizengella sp. 2205SS18-9]MDP5274210.1 sigma-70 family RNA polymerase sigma factor [Chengkuizengella sp. 2205SS18-9]
MAIGFSKNKLLREKEESFLSLIHENQEKLYRIAYSYVKNKDDALDIVQETVYKAYISYHKVKKIQYENTWLTRILINTSIDFIKKNNKVVSMDMEFIEKTSDFNNDNFHQTVEVKEAIEKLNEKQKTVIILRFFEDMKLEEIAKILESPVSTIKSTLYRALNEMNITLKE